METETLLGNRKVSLLFFRLVQGPARPAALARRARVSAAEAKRLLARMERGGLIHPVARGALEIDWERFVPIFVRSAMNIYAVALPWRYLDLEALERDPHGFVEAATARAGRELARIKMRLAANDLFCALLRAYFEVLVGEMAAPEDYLEDLRLSDAIDEFEYSLLKLFPLHRRRLGASPAARELVRLLGGWYRSIQAFDTPSGAALRVAFETLAAV
ncbi:MAG TPA: hypothetical protein PK668_01710 [Myxococcota bacterium]|nr:hypothetical protein [Myxococcota bacterium]HRY94716.1 hypothetical protein [Myxococcota bacterium]HSA22782.1 hypothetical protein [Myxococcota bacterium]